MGNQHLLAGDCGFFKLSCASLKNNGGSPVEPAEFGRATVLRFIQIHPNSQGFMLSQSIPFMFTEETLEGCKLNLDCNSAICSIDSELTFATSALKLQK
jgi:hypothetical protein